MKGLRVTKIVQEIKFEEVSGELEAKACFHRLSFTKYSRLTLVSTWNSALRVKFNFCFTEFLLAFTKFSFWQEDWTLGYHSMKLRHFPNISYFPKIVSLKPFSNSWDNSYIPCLEAITAHRFTCGERKKT